MTFDQKNIIYHFVNFLLVALTDFLILFFISILQIREAATIILTSMLLFFASFFVFWKLLRHYESLDQAKLHLKILTSDSFILSIGLLLFYFILYLHLHTMLKSFLGLMILFLFILGIYDALLYLIMPRLLK